MFAVRFYNWLSQFAPTFRGVVPEAVTIPNAYIKYDNSFNAFADGFIQSISVYSKYSTGKKTVDSIVDSISKVIGDGIILRDEDMCIAIYKGNPFYQDKTDEDKTIKAGFVNLEIKVYNKETV